MFWNLTNGAGERTVDQPDFTERDKHRLAYLQKIANEMLDEALKDTRLKRWQQLLGGVALIAFASIFFLPHGRGEMNVISYLFGLSSVAAFTLFFFVLFWKGRITKRVEEEFWARHGKEYKELDARRDAAEKRETCDWLR